MNVNTKIPKNYNKELERFLKKRQVYKANEPKINKIRNAFVTFDGLVLKNGLLQLGSAFNLIGFEDKTFYFQFWKEAFEKFLVSKWGKSIPSVQLASDKNYLLIHSKWFNYAFWINSYLTRLIQVEKELGLEGFVLIVPENWKSIPYVWDSITAFPIEVEIIPSDHQMFIPNLTYVDTRRWTSSFFPDTIKATKERMYGITDSSNLENNFPKKIYLTRAQRGVRCVENEAEILEILKEYNYQAVSFEGLSIWEQVNMMKNATHFISIHGAGLSNLMFLNEGAKVLELINQQYAELEYTFPFWKLASASELNYYMLLCNAINNSNKQISFGKNKSIDEKQFLVNSNILVDKKQFRIILDMME